MRDNDGRRLDHGTLEVLRVRALKQIEAGASVSEVAETLGLHRGSVSRWLTAKRRGGMAALRAEPLPGRPPALNKAQMDRLYDIVAHNNPMQLQLDFGLWTRQLVATVVKREFGVELHATTVGRVLRRLGFSPQRPLCRAYRQNPEAVDKWKSRTFPAIRKQAKKTGATIYFADEAGVRSDCRSGATWAPTGRTPIVRTTGARHRVNMLSAVTADGRLGFMTNQGGVGAEVFIEFCRRLLADTTAPIHLVVDGHPAHRAKATTRFVESTGGRLGLHFLPGYSPELNPDEWVWKNIKHDNIGKKTVVDGNHFAKIAAGALHRLQKLPNTIRGFFADPALAHIAT